MLASGVLKFVIWHSLCFASVSLLFVLRVLFIYIFLLRFFYAKFAGLYYTYIYFLFFYFFFWFVVKSFGDSALMLLFRGWISFVSL